jgi:hypothetical protein
MKYYWPDPGKTHNRPDVCSIWVLCRFFEHPGIKANSSAHIWLKIGKKD